MYNRYNVEGGGLWLTGNTLVSINEVTLHQARLVLGWETGCVQVYHLGM